MTAPTFLTRQPLQVGLTDMNTMGTQVSNSISNFSGSPFGYKGSTPLINYGINSDLMDGNAFAANSNTGSSDLFSKQSMFGDGGWVMPATQVGAGLLQGFMGLKQLQLAKDMFRQQQAYAATDLANQAKTVNERLETRQARRVKENPNATPVNEFMSKYAVSGKAGG